MDWEIREGDALELLAAIDAEMIDAVVTDPPAGIGFMGKDWDANKGGRDPWIEWLTLVMREALRVLKPGGHALVWALPRTSHWTATAIENAGFEIRDVVTHHFGTGFPKSLDVSKVMDKAARAEREKIGKGKGRTGLKAQPHGGSIHSDDNYQWPGEYEVTAPATDDAKQWQGWGTALKPASEHWILARKPLTGTVAANVQEHGTGALNIDGCRVGTDKIQQHGRTQRSDHIRQLTPEPSGREWTGRWPPNLLLSGDAIEEMDRQSGQSLSEGGSRGAGGQHGKYSAIGALPDLKPGYGDLGGASRFFPRFRYVPKANGGERNKDLDEPSSHPTVKPIALMRWLCRLITPPGGLVLDPFLGSGSTMVAALQEGFRCIGIEREPDYAAIARRRVEEDMPLFSRSPG